MNLIFILILTIILEFIVYLIILRKDIRKLLLYSILINSFTNPIINLLPYSKIILMEISVFVIEIFLIKYLFKIKYWKAILISLIANAIGFLWGFF